ncbi:MAG TPA: SpoIIE family protein phosphatase, partial [Pyrinomonadaceae bacterium]|nr:SpoIIE family protein phosphatase [Pyrinomonadaceae bacterium]
RLSKNGARAGAAFTAGRAWLRRVMPRVALAAGALLLMRVFFGQTALYAGRFGSLLGYLTWLLALAACLYYGFKSLRWLKRTVLWRVRRRLVITYLFVGLTPLVLLTVLGFLSAVGGSSQALGRIAVVEITGTQREVLSNARVLAEALARRSDNVGEQQLQTWLTERAALLRATLPGARVAAWRGRDEAEVVALATREPARFVAESEDEQTRGVGISEQPAGAPLPAWLAGREEWGGMAFLAPPRESDEAFGSPSLRAVVRRRNAVVLVSVPVSRALVKQWGESTGLRVRPFFIGAGADELSDVDGSVPVGPGDELARDDEARRAAESREGPNAAPRRDVKMKTRDGREFNFDLRHDQFGEAIPSMLFVEFWHPLILQATNWTTGAEAPHWAFMVDWSWTEAGKQFWNDETTGQFWRVALYYAAVTFLILELLALLSAAWMTRAVTGTVHRLYRATEFIKRGDFSHRIRVRSRDQLGELASAFNEMSANIESLLMERVERERLEREVEIAAEVQAQLFPRRVPELRTLEITGECRAARGVAGDYYDYVEVAPGLVAFALGDVSGKGLSAALVMSNLQASLRAQTTIIAERIKTNELAATAANVQSVAASTTTAALPHAPAPAPPAQGNGEQAGDAPCGVTGVDRGCAVERMVESVNAQLTQSTDANRFATLFLALYDDSARTLRYTNAGHNAPLLVRSGGALERLDTGGMMVGAFDFARYEEGRTALGPGDLLLIYSDGLSEAQNHLCEADGEQRLSDFTVSNRHLPADQLRRALFDEIDRWSGAQERDDDQTLVILKASAAAA